MKKIVTIAAVAALATLSACNKAEEAPVANEAVATENATEEAAGKGGPCGDGTELAEGAVCP